MKLIRRIALPNPVRSREYRTGTPSWTPYCDLHRPGASCLEGVAALRGQQRAEAVTHEPNCSAEAITEPPTTARIRPNGREGPPPATEMSLHLHELPASGDWTASHSTPECHRLAIPGATAACPEGAR